jgi:hypothetical protein
LAPCDSRLVVGYVHKIAMEMVFATAEDIATVPWAMLHLFVITLVQVAVRTVAQPLIPVVSVLFSKEKYGARCSVIWNIGFNELRCLAVVIIII